MAICMAYEVHTSMRNEISVTTNNISVDVWLSVLTIRALLINNGVWVVRTLISYQEERLLVVKGITFL